MASWGPGHLDVFVLGADSAAYQKRFLANAWSPSWTSLGGNFIHEPVAISTQPGTLDVFAVGVDGRLWQKRYRSGAWLPSQDAWSDMGGKGEWMDKPTVVSWGPDKINLFILDKYHVLWRNYWNGWTWSGFVSLGGQHLHTPAVVSTGPKKLDIFSVGSDNALRHKWFDGLVWGPNGVGGEWESMGQKVIGEVRAMTRPGDATGVIDVFYVGWDSELRYKSAKAGSGVWRPLDKSPTWPLLGVVSRSSPTIVALDTKHLQVFVTGSQKPLRCLVSKDGGVSWKEEAMYGSTIPVSSVNKREKDHLSTALINHMNDYSLHRLPTLSPIRMASR